MAENPIFDARPKHIWMVRAGNGNELADLVEEKSAVAIGWDKMGDLINLNTREEFKRRYREIYPKQSNPRVNVNTGQIYRFTREIQIGDYVLTYDKSNREVLIGIIRSDYEKNPSLFSEEYPYVREVE